MNQKAERTVVALVEELQGYLDINMQTEARQTIRMLLQHPSLTDEGFCEAIRGIGMGDFPRSWRSLVERAYRTFPSKEQKNAGAGMLAYYYTIWEPEEALPFCRVRHLHSPGNLMFAMNVVLHFGNLLEAKSIANKCRNLLKCGIDSFDAGCLIDALGSYYARTRQWKRAISLWSTAPRDEAFGGDAAISIAELYVVGALDTVIAELSTVASLDKAPLSHLALSLPGVEAKLLKDSEEKLLKLKRSLERIIPGKKRIAYGL